MPSIGYCVAKVWFLACKKGVFALQEGGFYTPKTPFLFFVSITNTLLMCYEHSARRRGPIHRARILTLLKTCISITKYVFPFHRTHISTLSITCFHIIKYVHSFYYTNISVCHFVGVYVYAGTINRTPTAADRLPKHCERSAITLRTPTKCATKQPPMVANGLPIIQYLCVIMRCLWDIKIGEAQNTFVFLHFSTTHFIRRYLGNCATIWRVACPKKVRCLC